jgi:hypothetical protein
MLQTIEFPYVSLNINLFQGPLLVNITEVCITKYFLILTYEWHITFDKFKGHSRYYNNFIYFGKY